MTRFAFTVEFDGRPFMGWQRQAHGPSVQQAIEDAIHAVTGERVVVHAAGRTDAGVHGLAMRAHADVAKPMTPFRLMEAINARLGRQPVAILGCEEVSDDWQGALRARILAAREIMLRHRWAPRVLETRTEMNMPVIAWFDQVLGVLRAGGFSWDLAHHAMHALGSRALGFTQELFEPDDAAAADEEAVAMLEAMAAAFPNIVGMMTEVAHDDPDSTIGWCDDQHEFEFALDLLLDGLERRRRTD